MKSAKALQLFLKLKSSGIVNSMGTIQIELLGSTINVSQKSAIGNLIEEWLGGWMKDNLVEYRPNKNTQEPPDFYLGEADNDDLLEIKAFDYKKTPNFDLANFDSYVRCLTTQAYKLDSDYLIFGYTLKNGNLTINDIWLKKIWEISCPSEAYPLRTQRKQDKIINLRPYNFKASPNKSNFQPFSSRMEFVTAIKETLSKYLNNQYSQDPESWFTKVASSYKETTKKSL